MRKINWAVFVFQTFTFFSFFFFQNNIWREDEIAIEGMSEEAYFEGMVNIFSLFCISFLILTQYQAEIQAMEFHQYSWRKKLEEHRKKCSLFCMKSNKNLNLKPHSRTVVLT